MPALAFALARARLRSSTGVLADELARLKDVIVGGTAGLPQRVPPLRLPVYDVHGVGEAAPVHVELVLLGHGVFDRPMNCASRVGYPILKAPQRTRGCLVLSSSRRAKGDFLQCLELLDGKLGEAPEPTQHSSPRPGRSPRE
eukprot:2445436-Pyramimonas_sp.AAC.1